MNNIDFDETVEFVWDWVVQLNAHLLSHNWGTIGGTTEQYVRGLSGPYIQDLSSELLKMIFDSEEPELFMKAMNRQIQSFQTITQFPQLPRAYLKIIDINGGEASRWDLKMFTEALHTDISRIVQCYNVIQKQAERQYTASTKKHKM